MAIKPLPSPEVLRQLLRYEPDTGKLFWLERPRRLFKSNQAFGGWNARFEGKEAFTNVTPYGYMTGGIWGERYLAHRVIWVIHHGCAPTNQIDHINGDPADNRIINLRDVTLAENARNAKMKSNNTSGYNGVVWMSSANKWSAQICFNGSRRMIGVFDNIEDAAAARKSAQDRHDFTARHGT